MKQVKLTRFRDTATSHHQRLDGVQQMTGKSVARAGMAMASVLMLTGCINISTPEEPIVIELNINIRQEVIYRLAEDAANTIDENADIF